MPRIGKLIDTNTMTDVGDWRIYCEGFVAGDERIQFVRLCGPEPAWIKYLDGAELAKITGQTLIQLRKPAVKILEKILNLDN